MWSLALLEWLGHLRTPVGNALMVGASWLGSEDAYLILGAIVYLCVGYRLGFHLLVMFLLSVFINCALKDLAGTTRPFLAHPDLLQPLYVGSAGGDSFPSGHSQTAAVVWGLLAVYAQRPRVRAALVAVVVLVGLSRLYLQVHWPIDVVGGWLIGVLMLGAYLLVMGAWQSAQPRVPRLLGAGLIVLTAVVMVLAEGREATVVQAAGTLLGGGLGFLLLDSQGGFRAGGGWRQCALRVLGALALVLAVRYGLKAVMPPGPAWAMVRYALMGFALTYVVPVVSIRAQGRGGDTEPAG